jgi:hypothetical protein
MTISPCWQLGGKNNEVTNFEALFPDPVEKISNLRSVEDRCRRMHCLLLLCNLEPINIKRTSFFVEDSSSGVALPGMIIMAEAYMLSDHLQVFSQSKVTQ